MKKLKLYYMNQNEAFPFFVQAGQHDEKMELHTHEDFSELVIVTEGSATHIVDNESFRIKKGDVFVLGAGVVHGYEHAENFRIYNIMFRVEDILGMGNDIMKSTGFHSLFIVEPSLTSNSNFKSRLTISAESFRPIDHLVHLMLEEYEGENGCRESMIMSYFMVLVVTLSRLYDAHEPSSQENIFNIANAASYMENHYENAISLPQLSELSHYSLRHFIRLFNITYHMTPQRYLARIRFRHACLYLKETDLSIMEIAGRCGFSDSNYFSTAFKKEFGMSPVQYRRSLR